jgi:hypothetical protein
LGTQRKRTDYFSQIFLKAAGVRQAATQKHNKLNRQNRPEAIE